MADEERYEDEFEDQEGEEEEEEYYDDEDEGLSGALSGQLKSAPWYLSSLVLHMLGFLILMLIPATPKKPKRKRVIIVSEIVEEEEKPLEEPEPDIREKETEVETETEVDSPVVVTTTDVEITTELETDDDMDKETPKGDPNEISDVDNDSTGVPAMMGVGASGGGGGGRYGFRNGGGRRKALRGGGGGPRTESAVTWALKWLAAHQESDGHWDCAKYEGGKADHAVTALATLAFLGAGNTPRFGKFKHNVQTAVEWLVSQQDANGCIGPHRYQGGITLMALAEAYGMTGDRNLKDQAQKCVDWAVKSQCPAGGWDYTPTAARNDTSVTGWWVMGLKSARVAELDVPYDTFEKALKYIDAATKADGKGVFYAANTPTVEAVAAAAHGQSARRSAIALTCLQFLGRPRGNPKVIACAKFQTQNLPNAGNFDFYQWYYSALGMFQMGVRSDYWKVWNEPMKTALLSTQVREGTFEQNKGSWDPGGDHFGARWGRVGQTALGALMLEVYYRYMDCHSSSYKKNMKH